MNFRLTEEQKYLQAAVRDFVKAEFKKDVIQELLDNDEYPVKIWKKAAEHGFIGIHFPKEYSGRGLSLIENILVCEELCRGDSTIGICLSLADFASDLLLHHGNDEQKAKWLSKVAKGQILSCGAFTEPDHGSDITDLDTTAVRDGNEWIINGSKMFISNGGPLAGFYSVLCKTDPGAKPGYRGLSLILIEADRRGVSATDVGPKMGINLSNTAEVVFSDVRVPLINLIGEENRGFYQVLQFFNESRVEVAAQALGIAQGAFDRVLNHVEQRRQFGKRIGEFQTIRHKIADMATKIETARLLVYSAALNISEGRTKPGLLTAMAKLYSARTAVEVCDDAIQLLGGYGYMQENEVERFYRDAKITELYEGTKEIQKNTIANHLLSHS